MADKELRRQRLSRLHEKLLDASNRFPMFLHFAMRSDDSVCWRALCREEIDGVPMLPEVPFDPFDLGDRPRLLELSNRLSAGRFANDEDEIYAKLKLIHEVHEWVWATPLFNQHRYGTDCFRSSVTNLEINKEPWAGRFVDPTMSVASELSGHVIRTVRSLSREVVLELNGSDTMSRMSTVGEKELERRWVETLYGLFPQDSTMFGPIETAIEIVTLPWNLFLTTAHAIEKMLDDPNGEFDPPNATPELVLDASSPQQPASTAAPCQPNTKAIREQRPKRMTIDQRMKLVLFEKPESSSWSITEFQTELKCSRAGIHKTASWKALEAARTLGKVERRNDRRVKTR